MTNQWLLSLVEPELQELCSDPSSQDFSLLRLGSGWGLRGRQGTGQERPLPKPLRCCLSVTNGDPKGDAGADQEQKETPAPGETLGRSLNLSEPEPLTS